MAIISTQGLRTSGSIAGVFSEELEEDRAGSPPPVPAGPGPAEGMFMIPVRLGISTVRWCLGRSLQRQAVKADSRQKGFLPRDFRRARSSIQLACSG
jgi:hypothetical protein